MPKSELAAVLLALAAAFASAIGNVARQRSAHEVTDGRVGYLALFFMSWRNRDWRLGAVAAVANYGLQAAALSLGSVILVTGLQVTALLFALPLYARMTGAPVSQVGLELGGDIGHCAGRRRHRRQSGGRIFAGTAAHVAGGCRHRGAVGWSVSAGGAALAGSGDRSGAAGCGVRCVAGAVRGVGERRCRRGQGRHRGGPGHSRALCLHRRCRSPGWCSSSRHIGVVRSMPRCRR